jgi:hypothetical protein
VATPSRRSICCSGHRSVTLRSPARATSAARHEVLAGRVAVAERGTVRRAHAPVKTTAAIIRERSWRLPELVCSPHRLRGGRPPSNVEPPQRHRVRRRPDRPSCANVFMLGWGTGTRPGRPHGGLHAGGSGPAPARSRAVAAAGRRSHHRAQAGARPARQLSRRWSFPRSRRTGSYRRVHRSVGGAGQCPRRCSTRSYRCPNTGSPRYPSHRRCGS